MSNRPHVAFFQEVVICYGLPEDRESINHFARSDELNPLSPPSGSWAKLLMIAKDCKPPIGESRS
jgi:hypothetical protein